MAISIRNKKAERLVREVAKETGEGLTQAIINSLEERLERIRGRRIAPDLMHDILEISERCSKLPTIDERTPAEILGYDETGTNR